ncbi:MAG TPA: VTT domain-containing protein [Candidatus Saccharimonadales bacterium]|nr:VTT domain-containing protein [Candidatus Saccharimonadales bacterium]
MSWLDPNELIASGGLVLIAFMVFAESGLLFGFFFPGDTLLLAAGILSAGGEFDIVTLISVVIISAILGGLSGYIIGRKAGPRLFKKEEGIIFRREYVIKSEDFYERHGGKTIVLARFFPIIRTFAPVVAGIGRMNPAKFMFYNVLGSGIWAAGVTLLGYYFGQQIPNLDKYILPVILLATVVTFSPTVYHIVGDPKARQKIKEKLFPKR